MLPSINSNYNGNNPIISNSTDQTLLYHKPFINDDDTPSLFSSLYHFPSSPFTHYQSENDELFLQTYQDLPFITTTTAAADHNTNNPTAADTNMINNMLYNMVDSNKTSPTPTPPRKRTSKKDRHSKINTAKGLRDRRMRLSFEIARDFFGLQDILGFDKASRTVGWLLSKAESDIKKLVAVKSGGSLIHTVDSSSVVGAKSGSSASECEVISGIEHGKPSKCVNKEKNMRRDARKGAVSLARSRESREKARAWARERTKAKSKLLIADDATTIQDSNQVGSSLSPMSLEVVQALAEVEKPNSHDGRCVGGVADMVDQDDDHSFQVIMDKWSSTSIFNYHCTTGISQEQQQHQFEDFQCYNKSWESYNIQSLL